MERALQSHPDFAFRDYLMSGITKGFRISSNRLKSSNNNNNMRLALDNPQVAQQYLEMESSLGHIVGPLPLHVIPCAVPLGYCICSNIGAAKNNYSPSGASN